MKRILLTKERSYYFEPMWPRPGNLELSCAVDICAGRRGKLNQASLVETALDGATAKKKNNI